MRLLTTVLVGCCAALVASQTFASLVIDLRFTDGSTTKDISTLSAGQTVTIQVWATITGTDADHTNDGLTYTYFGVLSNNADLAHLTGNVANTSAVLPPFTDPLTFGPGTFADRNADTIGDWRGTYTSHDSSVGLSSGLAGWPKASFDLSARQFGGGSVGQAVGSSGWEFLVANAVFQIGSLSLPGSGSINVLDLIPVLPQPLFFSTRASFVEDGVNQSGVNLAAGTSVTFTLSAVPEPSGLVLAGVGLISVAGYTWRKRRWRYGAG